MQHHKPKPILDPSVRERKTAEDYLLDDRRMQDFIGRRLPFSLADDPTFEPLRYDLAGEWLDLLVLYFPGWGWEVQVLDRSGDDFGLWDVYSDLKEDQLRTTGAKLPPATPLPSATVENILARLERLEHGEAVPVAEVESPYLTAEEAAGYLRLNVNALYSLVERRRLRPLPGHRKYRFTREILDAYLTGK